MKEKYMEWRLVFNKQLPKTSDLLVDGSDASLSSAAISVTVNTAVSVSRFPSVSCRFDPKHYLWIDTGLIYSYQFTTAWEIQFSTIVHSKMREL